MFYQAVFHLLSRVREAAKFWVSFYEQAAQIRIPTYEDYATVSKSSSEQQESAGTSQTEAAKYLAIYSQKSPPEGTTRFQLQRVYPVVDEANPHNGPTSMEFLDMSEQFVKKFVIPPEDRESPPLTEGKRGPYNVKSGRKEGRKEAGSGSQPLTHLICPVELGSSLCHGGGDGVGSCYADPLSYGSAIKAL
ncbi:hypothetical protein BDP27DRAFT_1363827 [Rhodocollybia butyracea]|uniref:Uncharacterized protein n=1 Tax=Rhodocollybia butyracea TaxID=206335 RepID=A0A9P5PVH8_9AGAR|nr:hypothetical protein BDP27DRAFT_1363827 [Rhodocollybia butyracea]